MTHTPGLDCPVRSGPLTRNRTVILAPIARTYARALVLLGQWLIGLGSRYERYSVFSDPVGIATDRKDYLTGLKRRPLKRRRKRRGMTNVIDRPIGHRPVMDRARGTASTQKQAPDRENRHAMTAVIPSRPALTLWNPWTSTLVPLAARFRHSRSALGRFPVVHACYALHGF